MGEIDNAISKFETRNILGLVSVNGLSSQVQILYSPREMEIRNLTESFNSIRFTADNAELPKTMILDNQHNWISLENKAKELEIYRLLDPRLIVPYMKITETRIGNRSYKNDGELDTIIRGFFSVSALPLPGETSKFFGDYGITIRDIAFRVVSSNSESFLTEMIQKDLPPFEDLVQIKFEYFQ